MSRLKKTAVCLATIALLGGIVSEATAIDNQGLSYLRFYQIPIHIRNLTNLEEDRVVFHSFNVVDEEGRWIHTSSPNMDNSLSTLLVIRNDRIYILRDGYENPELLQEAKKSFWVDELAWQNQKVMIRKFQDLQKELDRYLVQAGPKYPQTRNASRKIDVFLEEYDSQYRTLVRRHEIEKRKMYSHKINFGPASQEYLAQEKIVKAMAAKVSERNKNLRESLIALGKPTPENAEAPKTSIELIKRPPPFERQSFYVNTVDGVPDYVQVGHKNGRVPDLERLDTKERKWVSENFSDFYKTVRDRHLKRFTNQYRDLISKPTKYNARVVVTRHVLLNNFLKGKRADRKGTAIDPELQQGNITEVKEQKPAAAEGPENRTVEFLRIDAVGNDGTLYTAIDANGDGITESFLVNEPGGFNWGTEKAANVVSIFNNREAEVQKLIGDLVAFARRGGDESEKNLVEKKGELQKEVLDCIGQEENISRSSFTVDKDQPVACKGKEFAK